jgi:hypothetical protein
MENEHQTGDQRNKSVNLNDRKEVEYWTDKFKITNVQLRAAVNAAGTTASDLEAYLQKKDSQR